MLCHKGSSVYLLLPAFDDWYTSSPVGRPKSTTRNCPFSVFAESSEPYSFLFIPTPSSERLGLVHPSHMPYHRWSWQRHRSQWFLPTQYESIRQCAARSTMTLAGAGRELNGFGPPYSCTNEVLPVTAINQCELFKGHANKRSSTRPSALRVKSLHRFDISGPRCGKHEYDNFY